MDSCAAMVFYSVVYIVKDKLPEIVLKVAYSHCGGRKEKKQRRCYKGRRKKCLFEKQDFKKREEEEADS